MEYHPGGEDELMKAAGADGTDLFDQVRTTGSEWHFLTKRYFGKNKEINIACFSDYFRSSQWK